MATKNDTSKARPSRNPASAKRSASSRSKPAKAAPTPQALEDIVEDERARLMKAHSILSCVITAMEDDDVSDSDGPYWPAVIETACDLINESIRKLEDLDYSPKPSRPKNEVREPATAYGHRAMISSSFLTSDDAADRPGANWRLTSAEAAEQADIAAAQEPLTKPPRLN